MKLGVLSSLAVLAASSLVAAQDRPHVCDGVLPIACANWTDSNLAQRMDCLAGRFELIGLICAKEGFKSAADAQYTDKCSQAVKEKCMTPKPSNDSDPHHRPHINPMSIMHCVWGLVREQPELKAECKLDEHRRRPRPPFPPCHGPHHRHHSPDHKDDPDHPHPRPPPHKRDDEPDRPRPPHPRHDDNDDTDSDSDSDSDSDDDDDDEPDEGAEFDENDVESFIGRRSYWRHHKDPRPHGPAIAHIMFKVAAGIFLLATAAFMFAKIRALRRRRETPIVVEETAQYTALLPDESNGSPMKGSGSV